MIKNLQRVALEVSIYWCYVHRDAGKAYSETSIMKSIIKSSIQKQICAEI